MCVRTQIEAKIGLLLDQRAGNQRVHLPVPIETSAFQRVLPSFRNPGLISPLPWQS
jgi:hypothetical protein